MTTTVLAYFPSPGQGVWYLGPVPIRAYALCIIAGIIAALVIGDRRWVARGGERGVIYDIALWAVPFGLIGGRIYHLMTDWRTYFGPGGAGPVAALRIWEGGLGIWGAVAFGGVGAWIACRRRGIPLPAFGDAVAPGIVLAQAIGRLGNYFNQELYGRETTVPWGMEIFYRRDPSGLVDVHSLDGVSTGQVAAVVHPTFLYELLWNLLVFFFLLWADRRFRLGHGRLFALYVASYCVGRFWVELLRDDTATHIAGIRINVFTATFVFIGAVVYMLLAPKGREDPASLQGDDEWEDEESRVEEFAEELVSTAAGSGILAATTGGGILAAATVAGEHEREDALAAGDEESDHQDPEEGEAEDLEAEEVEAEDLEAEDVEDTAEDNEELVESVDAEEMAAEAERESEPAEAGADASDRDEGPVVVYSEAAQAETVVIYASGEPDAGDEVTEAEDADEAAAPEIAEAADSADEDNESDDIESADDDRPDDDGLSEAQATLDSELDTGDAVNGEADDDQADDDQADDDEADNDDEADEDEATASESEVDADAHTASDDDADTAVAEETVPVAERAPAAGAADDKSPRLGSSLRRLLFGGRGRG